MKKNVILCTLAGVLLVGGVVLIIPMFKNPVEPVVDTTETVEVELTPEEQESADQQEAREEQGRRWREGVNEAANQDDMSPRGIFVFMMSDKYTEMPEDEKAAYNDEAVEMLSDPEDEETDMVTGMVFWVERIPEEHFDTEQMAVAMRAAEKRLERFFALDPDVKNAILDRFIAMEEMMRKGMAENPDDERVKEFQREMTRSVTGATGEQVEQAMLLGQRLSPKLRAYREAVTRAYDNRRKERKLPKSLFAKFR